MKILSLMLLLLFENGRYGAQTRNLPLVPKENFGKQKIPLNIDTLKKYKYFLELFGDDFIKKLTSRNNFHLELHSTRRNRTSSSSNPRDLGLAKQKSSIGDEASTSEGIPQSITPKPLTFPAFTTPEYVKTRATINIKDRASLMHQDQFLQDLFLVDEEMTSSGILSQDIILHEIDFQNFTIRRIGKEGPFILFRKDAASLDNFEDEKFLNVLLKELQSLHLSNVNGKQEAKLPSHSDRISSKEIKLVGENQADTKLKGSMRTNIISKVPRQGRKIRNHNSEEKKHSSRSNREFPSNITQSTYSKNENASDYLANNGRKIIKRLSKIRNEADESKKPKNIFDNSLKDENQKPLIKQEIKKQFKISNANLIPSDETTEKVFNASSKAQISEEIPEIHIEDEVSRAQKIRNNINKLKYLIHHNEKISLEEKLKLISILEDDSLTVQQQLRLLQIEASSKSKRQSNAEEKHNLESHPIGLINPEEIIKQSLLQIQNSDSSAKLRILQNLIKEQQMISSQKYIVLNMLRNLHEEANDSNLPHNFTQTEMIFIWEKLESLSNTVSIYRQLILSLVAGRQVKELDISHLIKQEVPLSLHKLLTSTHLDFSRASNKKLNASVLQTTLQKGVSQQQSKDMLAPSKFMNNSHKRNPRKLEQKYTKDNILKNIENESKELIETPVTEKTETTSTTKLRTIEASPTPYNISTEDTSETTTTPLPDSTTTQSSSTTITEERNTNPPYPPLTEPPGFINKNFFPEFLTPAIEVTNKGLKDLEGRSNQAVLVANQELSFLAEETIQKLINGLRSGTESFNEAAYDTYRGARQIQFFLERMASNSVPFWGRLLGVAMKELLSRTANIVNSFGDTLATIHSNIFGGLSNGAEAVKVFLADQAQAVNTTIQKTARVIERVALNAIQAFTGFDTKSL